MLAESYADEALRDLLESPPWAASRDGEGVRRIQIREGCFRYEMDHRENFAIVRRGFAIDKDTFQRLDGWVWSVDECFYQRRCAYGAIKQKDKSRRMPRERGLGAGFECLEAAEIVVSRYFGAPIAV